MVLVLEPGRALGRCDVADVISWPIVAEVAVSASIARCIDPGLLVSTRRPRLDIAEPSRPHAGAE